MEITVKTLAPRVLSVLRIIAGFTFSLHGFQKLCGVFGGLGGSGAATHSPKGFWPIVNGGELAVLYCFLFLYVTVAGPSPVRLEGLFRKRSL